MNTGRTRNSINAPSWTFGADAQRSALTEYQTWVFMLLLPSIVSLLSVFRGPSSVSSRISAREAFFKCEHELPAATASDLTLVLLDVV